MSNKYFLGSSAILQAPTGASVSVGLTALGGSAYDNSNSSNLFFWGDMVLSTAFATAPVSGTIDLYLVPAPDGTTYMDASGTVLPANLYVGSWQCNGSLTQVLIIRGVSLPPFLFKAFIYNNSGQIMSADWEIQLFPYSEQ